MAVLAAGRWGGMDVIRYICRRFLFGQAIQPLRILGGERRDDSRAVTRDTAKANRTTPVQ